MRLVLGSRKVMSVYSPSTSAASDRIINSGIRLNLTVHLSFCAILARYISPSRRLRPLPSASMSFLTGARPSSASHAV